MSSTTPIPDPDEYVVAEMTDSPGLAVPSAEAGSLAGWSARAQAALWDFLYVLPAFVFVALGIVLISWGQTIPEKLNNTDPERIGLIVMLAGLAWALVRLTRNRFLDQGRTGWTYGKRKVGIRALNTETGAPMGVGTAAARDVANAVLNIVVFVSYLLPLFDSGKQTFGDKFARVSVKNDPDPEGVRPFTRAEDSTDGDYVAGAMFIFLGAGFAYGAAGYTIRSFVNPGAGLFPVLIGLVIAGLGATIFIRALIGKGEVTPGLSQFPWRAMAFLSASMVFFSFAIEDLGLFFTALGTALLASAASPAMTILRAIMTSVGIALLSFVLFNVLLHLPIQAWPWGG